MLGSNVCVKNEKNKSLLKIILHEAFIWCKQPGWLLWITSQRKDNVPLAVSWCNNISRIIVEVGLSKGGSTVLAIHFQFHPLGNILWWMWWFQAEGKIHGSWWEKGGLCIPEKEQGVWGVPGWS